MNNKITFHQLAENVSRLTSVSSESAETFIKGFFDTLTEALEKGETVRIKGLGTFTPIKSEEECVDFIPDRDLADTVNAPFAPFQAEEINTGVTDEMLDGFNPAPSAAEKAIASAAVTEEIEEAEPEALPQTPEEDVVVEERTTEKEEDNDVNTPAKETEPPAPTEATEKEPNNNVTPTMSTVEQPASPVAPVIKPIEEDPEEFVNQNRQNPAVKSPTIEYAANNANETADEKEDESSESRGGFGFGFIAGIIIGFALGACAAYFYIDQIMQHKGIVGNSLTESVEADDEEADPEVVAALLNEAMALDSVAQAAIPEESPAKPEGTSQTEDEAKAEPEKKPEQQAAPAPATKAPVTDTVKRGYLITNMASKHYGNKCFWIYIYNENSAKIGNPNRINAGMVLTIPDASKYNIDANNPESVKKARALEAEILKKYPN